MMSLTVRAISKCDSMEQVLGDVRRHSAEREFKLLAGKLQSAAEHMSGMDVATLDTVVDSLEPGKHSLGIMAALWVGPRARDCDHVRVHFFSLSSAAKLSKPAGQLNWTLLLEQLRSFAGSFSREQVKEAALSCG